MSDFGFFQPHLLHNLDYANANMESLSETHWDLVIEGTGLQQSLLALYAALGRQRILSIPG